jgi:hypothetical protein
MDFVRRGLLARWADDLDRIRAEYEPDEAEISEALVCRPSAPASPPTWQGDWPRAAFQHRAAVDVDESEAERIAGAVPRAAPAHPADLAPGAAGRRLTALARLGWPGASSRRHRHRRRPEPPGDRPSPRLGSHRRADRARRGRRRGAR